MKIVFVKIFFLLFFAACQTKNNNQKENLKTERTLEQMYLSVSNAKELTETEIKNLVLSVKEYKQESTEMNKKTFEDILLLAYSVRKVAKYEDIKKTAQLLAKIGEKQETKSNESKTTNKENKNNKNFEIPLESLYEFKTFLTQSKTDLIKQNKEKDKEHIKKLEEALEIIEEKIKMQTK